MFIFIFIIYLNEKKLAYSFKLSDDSASNLGQDLEGKLHFSFFHIFFLL